MRKNILKFISIFICIMLLFSSISPVFALEEIIDEENNQNEIIDEEKETEEIKEEIDEELVEEEKIEEENITNEVANEIRRVVKSIEELNMNISFQDSTIKPLIEDNIYYFFVPQPFDLTNISINYTGDITNISSGSIDIDNKIITNDFSQNNEMTITYDEKEYIVRVLKSNLPSISISLNGVTLSQINSNSKEIKYPNNSFSLFSDSQNLSDSSVEIKGRGNYSWGLPQKSYQVKLSSKVNILGMGKSKTWLLIENYSDNSLLRNKTAYDLGNNIGLDYTQKTNHVDLWVDGEYIGIYLLTEKVQVGSNRVELTDDDGLIVEMDNVYYAYESDYFSSNITGSHFVLKDSEAEDGGVSSFKKFKKYINEFESKLYSDEKNWDEISSMIDVESFVKYFFVQEFTENSDGAKTSMFMYKDGDNDVLHMGPVWDFDITLGNCYVDYLGGNPNLDYITNIKKYTSPTIGWYNELYKIPEFRAELLRIYNEEVKDNIQISINNLDVYKEQLTLSSNMHFIRWKTLGTKNVLGSSIAHKNKDTYEEEVAYLKNWMTERFNYLNRKYSSESDIIKLKYNSHIQNIGWEKYNLTDSEISGTEGRSLRLEAFSLDLDTFNSEYNDSSIVYQTHVQNIGWQDYVSNGELSGTTGLGLRLEAIKIKLTGKLAEDYSIRYRVHVQNVGWQDWKYDGELAGTTGLGLRLEAIQVELVKINPNTISSTSHIQNIGWTSKKLNETLGTIGLGLRLETFTLNIENKQYNGDIEYRSYINKNGWQDYVKNGEKSGTEGKSKAIEKINIRLTDEMAENYDIYYRVHVQNIGWLDWAKNDEITGNDLGLRIEALEVVIVDKGTNPPERIANLPGVIYYER